MKKLLSIFAALTIAFSVSGCTAQTPEQAAIAMFDSLPKKCEAYPDGNLSKSLVVKGTSGVPKVTFKPGLTPKKPEVHLVNEGQGAMFTGNQTVTFEIAAINGQTGEAYPESSGFLTKFDRSNAVTTLASDDQTPQINLCSVFAGHRVGSRVAGVFPLKTDATSQGPKSIVLVLDLINVFLPRATGPEKSAVSGIPSAVRSATTGEPGLVFPSNVQAPTGFEEYVSVEGAGAELKTGDHILAHYKLYLWNEEHTMVQSSWASQPLDLTVGTGLIEGFSKALVGQKIGSQVVAVIPPALGYGDAEQQSIPAKSTLVFVIDILGKY
ncbi:MAG: hypothetical protein RLZ28_1139 [Actinomycetota bacterium]